MKMKNKKRYEKTGSNIKSTYKKNNGKKLENNVANTE